MASQVLSGSSNPSYTNSTGQNVRIVINYMGNLTSMSWAGVSISSINPITATAIPTNIGRNLAFSAGLNIGGTGAIGVGLAANNMMVASGQEIYEAAYPTEIMLSDGQSFSAACGAYNIVIIPENN